MPDEIRIAIVLSHVGSSSFGENRQLVIAKKLREMGFGCDVFRIALGRDEVVPASGELAELNLCPVDNAAEPVPQKHTSDALRRRLKSGGYDFVFMKGMKYDVNRQIIEDDDARAYGSIVGGSHRDPLMQRYQYIFSEHAGQEEHLRAATKPGTEVIRLPKYLPLDKMQSENSKAKTYDIVCNGKFVARKNQALLKPLFDSEFSIVFIGDGENLDEMKAYAADRPNVTFLGAVKWEQAVKTVSASRVLAHPSVHEGLPRAAVDAFTYGVPLVGLEQTLGPALNESGCCVLTTAEDFCDEVVALLHDQPRLDALSEAARSYSAANHSPAALDNAVKSFADWACRLR